MCQTKATCSGFIKVSDRRFGGRVHLGRDPRVSPAARRACGTSFRKSKQSEGEQGRIRGPMSGNRLFPLISLMHMPDERDVERLGHPFSSMIAVSAFGPYVSWWALLAF